MPVIRMFVVVATLAAFAAPAIAGEGAGNPFPGPNVTVGGPVAPLPSVRAARARPVKRVAPAANQTRSRTGQ